MKDRQDIPWVELYRPTLVQEIIGNEEAVSKLKVIAEQGNMPNMIISGPPGTGKTTSVMCLARALLGEYYDKGVLELNASDDRGIDVVRHKIKSFAQKKLNLPPGRQKVVILDEADQMTAAAQQALRRTMELYSSTTRFAFACNHSNKIIEPIQSRCAIIRFTRLSEAQITKRLLEICAMESVAYDEPGLQAIVFTADGDMRQALNNLQATHSSYGMISSNHVFRVCDQPHPLLIKESITFCKEGNLEEAIRRIEHLVQQGYAPIDILSTLFRVVKTHDDLPEDKKLAFIRKIGETHQRVVRGTDSFMQLTGLVASLCTATL